MAVMDYFNVSPGDKKRAELELQNRLRLGKGLSDIDTERAIKLRDSNQLNADFQRHKQERELQDTLSSMYPSTNPNLSNDENQTLALIHAGDQMNEIKASQPLSSSATNMNIAEQAVGARPLNSEVGSTGATSAIAGNEANAALGNLAKNIAKSRKNTAPPAAQMQDVANIAELVNKYDRATSAVPASERDRDIAENINRGKEANARNDSLQARTQRDISSAYAGAKEGDAMQAYWNNVNQVKAAEAANMKNEEQMSAYKFLIDNPKFNALIRNPALSSALGIEGILGNLGGTGGGGLNAPVGPRVPIGQKIQR